MDRKKKGVDEKAVKKRGRPKKIILKMNGKRKRDWSEKEDSDVVSSNLVRKRGRPKKIIPKKNIPKKIKPKKNGKRKRDWSEDSDVVDDDYLRYNPDRKVKKKV